MGGSRWGSGWMGALFGPGIHRHKAEVPYPIISYVAIISLIPDQHVCLQNLSAARSPSRPAVVTPPRPLSLVWGGPKPAGTIPTSLCSTALTCGTPLTVGGRL